MKKAQKSNKEKKAVKKAVQKSVSKAKTENKKGILPLGERVLVRPFTEEALRQAQGKNHFGIILPESMKEEKSAQGVVLAVGESKKVKVGDTVLFSKYSYDEVEWQGEDLYLLKEESLLAIINK